MFSNLRNLGQDAIDAYMAQTSLRSMGKQLSFDTVPDPDQDPEDEETQQDFETFKSWLAAMEKADAAVAESRTTREDTDDVQTQSDPKPSGPTSKPKCPTCKLPKRMCIPVTIQFGYLFLGFYSPGVFSKYVCR